MNYVEDVIQGYAFSKEAIIEIDESGNRTVHHFAELFARALGVSGALAEAGVHRGDVVTIATGTRAETAIVLLACLRTGFVAHFPEVEAELPAADQVRAVDPAAVVALTAEDAEALHAEPTKIDLSLTDLARIFDEDLPQATPASAAELAPGDPAIVTVDAEGNPLFHSQEDLQRDARSLAADLHLADQELVWWISGVGRWEDLVTGPWIAGSKALFSRLETDDPAGLLAMATKVSHFETEEGTSSIAVVADEDQYSLFPADTGLPFEAKLRLVSPAPAQIPAS